MYASRSRIKAPPEDIIRDNIIGLEDADKIISKQLIELILGPARLPLSILTAEDELVDFINQHAKQHVRQFIDVYNAVEQFRLLKFGAYVGCVQQKCAIFSENSVAFLSFSMDRWTGFSHVPGKSSYFGQFVDLKSEGEGEAIFVQQHEEGNKNKKLLFHRFKGEWKQGEIVKGSRKTYQSQNFKTPILEYEGEFQNFQFHGEGIRKRGPQQIRGTFQKGIHVKQKEQLKQNKEHPLSASRLSLRIDASAKELAHIRQSVKNTQ